MIVRFLITGGAGSVGQALTLSFLGKGHSVRVLDKKADQLQSLDDKNLELIKGEIEDLSVVNRAVKGMDVIVHLAWSFSDDPMELLMSDLKGHILLLDAAIAERISHFFYTSTAVVYGKPIKSPITEEDPCLVEDARKPFYGVAKLTAEKLLSAYFRAKGLPVTIFRFWWAFGESIDGRHLRDLIRKSFNNEPLEMVRGAGGTFVTMADLGSAMISAITKPAPSGQVYNVGSLLLTWEEIGRMIVDLTHSNSTIQLVPSDQWKGPAFLNEVWDLSWEKAERDLGFKPSRSNEEMRSQFIKTLQKCIDQVKRGEST